MHIECAWNFLGYTCNVFTHKTHMTIVGNLIAGKESRCYNARYGPLLHSVPNQHGASWNSIDAAMHRRVDSRTRHPRDAREERMARGGHTLHNCCPGERSSNGCLEKHREHAKSACTLFALILGDFPAIGDHDWITNAGRRGGRGGSHGRRRDVEDEVGKRRRDARHPRCGTAKRQVSVKIDDAAARLSRQRFATPPEPVVDFHVAICDRCDGATWPTVATEVAVRGRHRRAPMATFRPMGAAAFRKTVE